MDILFLIFGGLLVAVLGRAILDPWPSSTRKGSDQDRDHLMEDIARSFF
jgi:hypothetical protein